MLTRIIISFLIAASGLLISVDGFAQSDSAETEFTILAEDGVTLYGDLYDPSQDDPLILLFHQGGGSGRGEFRAILPRLLGEGYSAVSIDQRRGGDRFGDMNRTVAADSLGEWSYCDAMRDLEATLDFAVEKWPGRRIILWGGSYSGSLVIRLAAARGEDVAGVLAFSPASGGPMEACRPERAASELEVPALILRPASEMEIESIQAQMSTFSELGLRTFVAENGVHASSMLDSQRTGADTEATWVEVLAFLRSLSAS